MGQAISCLGSDGRTLLTAANDGDCEGVRQVRSSAGLYERHTSLTPYCFAFELQVLIEHVELAASAAFPKQCNCLHYAAGESLTSTLTRWDATHIG